MPNQLSKDLLETYSLIVILTGHRLDIWKTKKSSISRAICEIKINFISEAHSTENMIQKVKQWSNRISYSQSLMKHIYSKILLIIPSTLRFLGRE